MQKANAIMRKNTEQPGFGGVWVEYDPLRLVVATTDGKFDTASASASNVEVRQVRKDLNTLRKQSREIFLDFRRSSSAAISVGINARENRIDVEGNDDVVRYIDSLGKPASEVTRTKKEIKGANVQGGEHNNGAGLCTNGFSVRNSLGINLVSTAGHCSWADTVEKTNGGTESVSAWSEMCDIDSQVLRPGTGVSDGLVRNNVIKGWTDQLAPSTYVYSYGRTSGWRYGGAGDLSFFALSGSGECVGFNYNGRKASNAFGGNIDFQPGDSGGPLFTDCGCGGFYAVGMISDVAEDYILATDLLNHGFSFATA